MGCVVMRAPAKRKINFHLILRSWDCLLFHWHHHTAPSHTSSVEIIIILCLIIIHCYHSMCLGCCRFCCVLRLWSRGENFSVFFSFVFKLILCKFCSLNLLPAFGGELSAISKPVRSGKFCAIMSVVASIVWGLGGTHNYGALGIQI